MKVYLALLVALVVASADAFWLTSEPKENECGKYECPEYTVVEKFEGYELRHYGAVSWVYTPLPVMDGAYFQDPKHMKESFMKLFRYIRGANDQNMTIDMTVPVVITHMKDSAEMCFMVPSHLADNPPKPTEANVTLYSRNEADLYVRRFGGFPYGIFGNRNYFKVEMTYLYWDLMRDGQSFDASELFFTASYNDPWDLFNRRNEVWFRKV